MKAAKVAILRAKSPVHKSVIDENGHRVINPSWGVKLVTDRLLQDKWACSGSEVNSLAKKGILSDIAQLRKENNIDKFDL